MDRDYFEKRLNTIIQGLPQIPFAIQQVSAALARDDMDAQKLGKLLSADASLAAKILKTVNSPAFGLFRTVTDITWAVTVLGLKGVRDTLLSKQAFSMVSAGQPLSPIQKKHLLQCAETGVKICQLISRKDLSGELYAAGLIHDFGDILFEKAGCSSKADTLELNHADWGAKLLEKWNFPELHVQMTRFHHNPREADSQYSMQAHILYIAEMVASGTKDDPYFIEALETIKLSEKKAESL